MGIYQLSVEARNDLAEIWFYISEHSSDDTADRFIDRLETTCEKISEMPDMGNPQDHIREGLRRHSHGNYSIYYDTVEKDHIVIKRVWHQSRDLENFSILRNFTRAGWAGKFSAV